MRILIRNTDSKKWKFAESIKAKAEAELQRLLVESPSLITVDEIREGVSPLIFAIREFGLPGSGATDILAFSSDGDIAIIECKLATNPEIKRKVIGQILEYAAYLWQMSYEDVDSRIQKSKGKNLVELVKESVTEDWDEERFRNGVKQSLGKGSFILIIVVDEINEELKRIIRYINECSESAFSLHAFEMRRFKSEKIEVLVPHIYGISKKPPAGGIKKKWSEEEFFAKLEKDEPNALEVVKNIYNWSNGKADRIWFGTGKEKGSFTFHYLKEDKTISVFSIYTNGRLTLNYGWLSKKINKATLEGFHRRMHEISPLSHISSDFSKWPSVKILKVFKDPKNLEKFKQAVTWLNDAIKI